MKNRPYVIVKCAMSLDGYIDDASTERLILSNPLDFDRVDEERAKCDAILLGAETVRKDNPRVIIKSDERRKVRLLSGLTANPIKVTVTVSGNLSANLKFFTEGDSKKIVYCSNEAHNKLLTNLCQKAEIVTANDTQVDPKFILDDLFEKGVRKLMIEGGGKIITTFIGQGLADELQVSVAPFFVGEKNAPRFVNPWHFVNDKNNRMKLVNTEKIGDMALLTYHLNTL